MENQRTVKLFRSTREKVHKVAEAVALMEQGTYEFPDGLPKFCTQDGEQVPRVVRKEAMRYGGYAGESQSAYSNIFNPEGDWHDYYLERLNWHRQRLSGGFKKALAEITEGGSALRELSAAAYSVLMDQLQDPEAAQKMKPDVVAKIYLESTRLDSQIRGETETRKPGPAALPSVLNVINLPESHRHRLGAAQEVIEGEVVEPESE